MRTLVGMAGASLLLVAMAACNDDDGSTATTPTAAATVATTPSVAATATTSPSASSIASTPTRPSGASPTTVADAADYKRPPVVTQKAAAGTTQAVLRDVRVGRNEGYDRIVFEFDGAQLPGYEVKWVQAATQCGSGQPVATDGRAQLQVTLRPAVAHDENGKLTIPATSLKPGLGAIKEAKSSCDFEGVVSWVVGTTDSAYKVTELQGPTRLVIDILQ